MFNYEEICKCTLDQREIQLVGWNMEVSSFLLCIGEDSVSFCLTLHINHITNLKCES